MTSIKDEVFRAYDIRGIYPKDIDEDFALDAGRAFATYVKGKRIAVSMDVRTSNEALTRPFIEGLIESGAEVWFIGIAPTPLLYFTIAHYGLDGGAAVSASHNPPEWNGFKMCGRGAKVYGLGAGLEKIREIMKSKNFIKSEEKGVLVDKQMEVRSDYEKYLLDRNKAAKRLRIGIDPGNGADAEYAKELLAKMNVDVAAINDVRDGRFPSRNPEPKPDTITDLINFVKTEKLDFGVAFDGDGDRAMIVDDKGTVLYGDKIFALLLNGMVKKGDRIVYEVSCSDAITDIVKKKGAQAFVTPIGHMWIENKMVEVDAVMGGEISGHLYFREMYYFDDALFATAKIIGMVSASGRKLSDLVAELPQYKTVVREFDVDDKEKFKVVEKVKNDVVSKGYEVVSLDGAKVITENGWFLIRASNTSPKIKLTAEAKDDARIGELLSMGTRELEQYSGTIR